MPTVRFDLTSEYLQRLETLAAHEKMSVQEFIRFTLFGERPSPSVDDAIARICEGRFDASNYPDGFTLMDVYGDDWNSDRGPSGVIGRRFFQFVTSHPELGIKYMGMGQNGRKAHYTYEGGVQNER